MLKNSANHNLMRWFERLVLGFAVIGTSIGIATVLFVYRLMNEFRTALREQVIASGNPARLADFEETLRVEQLFSLGILALIVLVAALNIAAGVGMLRRNKTSN